MNTHKVLDGDNNVVLLAPEADCKEFSKGIPNSTVRLATGRETVDEHVQGEILRLNSLSGPVPTYSSKEPTVIWWCESCCTHFEEERVAEHEGVCPNCNVSLQAMQLLPVVADLPRSKHISEFSTQQKTAGTLSKALLYNDYYHDAILNAARKLCQDGYAEALYQTQGASGSTFWLHKTKTIRVSYSGDTAVIL